MSDENITQTEGTTAAAPAPDTGAERRIAELTAQKHELERQYAARFEEQSKQVADLIAAVGRMQTPQAPAAVPEAPPMDIDPDEIRKYEYIANKVMGPRLAQMQAQQQAYQQQQAQLAFQQYATRETNKEVADEAAKLWNYWQTSGNHKGFVIADAFTFARGTILERQQAAKGAETRFGGNDPSATVVTGHPQPPPIAPATGRAYPKNFDSLPWEEQERIYLEVLGNEPL